MEIKGVYRTMSPKGSMVSIRTQGTCGTDDKKMGVGVHFSRVPKVEIQRAFFKLEKNGRIKRCCGHNEEPTWDRRKRYA